MLDTVAIRMQAQPRRGLYESFYFRGTSTDGRQAFWLKHNMLRRRGSQDVWLQGALVLFDREARKTRAVYSQELMDAGRFERMSQIARDWDHVGMELTHGAVQIGRAYLGGRLQGEGGRARWDLQLHRSGLRLEPFPNAAMYRLPWPANKLVTRDCHVDFRGSVSVGDLKFSGRFHGMNGHNWGTGHAHAYAYASCSEFAGRDAYFDGFTAQVALAGGLLTSPRLSMASLHVQGQWHHFNGLRRAARHPVQRLDDYGWRLELANDTHRLEVDVDGASPAMLPWVALHYEHPDGKRSVVKSTKFAAIRLRLLRADGTLQDELAGDACELETLLPGNLPAGPGYFGEP